MTYLAETVAKRNDDDEEAEEIEENDKGPFDQIPVKVVCPHCHRPILTFIEHNPAKGAASQGHCVLGAL